MAKRIRTRAGRLRSEERKRRRFAASLRSGEVIVLDRARKRGKGKRSRNAISVEMVARGQWGMDTDICKLLHRIRVALARHDPGAAAGRPPG